MLLYTYQLHHYILWPRSIFMVKNPPGNNAALIHLFRKITQKSTPCSQHGDIQSDALTHICANMQSDRTDCNQTLAKHKHSRSFILSLSHTLTHTHMHLHINALAQCTNICHFINRSHTNNKKKKERRK